MRELSSTLFSFLIPSGRWLCAVLNGAADTPGPTETAATFAGLIEKLDRYEKALAVSRKEKLAIPAINIKGEALTITGIQLATVLGGVIVVEVVFAWPGLGRLVYNSVAARDYPVIQGAVLLMAVLFLVINLIVDLLYAVVDPRGEKQFAGRHAVGFELDPAIALARRRGCGFERPRPCRIGRANTDFDPAAMKPRDAQADIPKCPVLAGALIVDGEVAVLEAKLFQVMAVEAGFTDPVDPRQKRRNDVAGAMRRDRARVRGR